MRRPIVASALAAVLSAGGLLTVSGCDAERRTDAGTRWVYEGVVDGRRVRIELEVTAERRVTLGIAAVGVSDTNYVDGELAARTVDWYAQDAAGTVWYLGEHTQNYENGQPTDTEGWEAGVDGALPGICMLAAPTVGASYRQNYRAGQAEDLAEVVRLGATWSVGLGDYRDVIVIRGWTPREPETVEEKYYAPGVGKIYEVQIAGGDGGTELIEYAAADDIEWEGTAAALRPSDRHDPRGGARCPHILRLALEPAASDDSRSGRGLPPPSGSVSSSSSPAASGAPPRTRPR